MGLWDRLRGRSEPEQLERDVTLPFQAYLDYFKYGGNVYAVTGLPSTDDLEQRVSSSMQGYVTQLLRGNGIVFGCMALRLKVFSDVRFKFRKMEDAGTGQLINPTDGRSPTSRGLKLLRRPEPGLTTGDLLAHMIQDVDLTGNAFVHRRDDRLIRLRPDWVSVVYGSPRSANDATIWDIDTTLAGYLYHEGGEEAGHKPIPLLPETVAHWAPQPDPLSPRLGMSWLTPITREVLADSSATTHKLAFFENDATVNQQLVFEKGTDKEQFSEGMAAFKNNHEGTANAYKTLFLLGAKLEKVGTDFKEMDFTALQGKGETRIAMAAGLNAVVAALSEGLQGSSLNAGNFAAARRSVADMTFRPLWRNLCGSLANIIDEPNDAELWYDARDCTFLQEDRKDAAEIEQIKANTIANLVKEGFEAESAVAAVMGEDMSQLKHQGLVSVQLQKPGAKPDQPQLPLPNGNGKQPESLPVGTP